MIPILYEATETNFTSNGVCRLAEATECHVPEERNGEYELTLTYPITGKYYAQIQEGMYIAATHDDKGDRQPYRIYRRSAPFNGLVQFFARHISYYLNNVILNPITATSAADAFDQMETDTITANPFTMWTDVTSSGDFESKTPVSIRSALGGKQGSILDVYGGEYEWDMFTVKLHAQRGLDTDVTIRYGKNLTDLNQVIDAGGIYNAIVPYWLGTENDEDVLVTLPEHYVAATGVTNPVMVPMDFSSEFQDKPTVAELRSAASSFLSDNKPWIPSESIKISFVQLWQTEEYKDVAVLQRLSLCDRVNVYYPALGITAEGVKIIKTVYNVLLDRYDEMELGDARSSFADTLINPLENAITEAAQTSKSFLQKAIDHATKLITGGLGGHIVFMYDADGKPTEMLVIDTEDVGTAVHVLRINVNGIGFSSNGVNGPFTSAWTLDGQFVADFITAGTMLANRIKGGTLSLGGSDNGNGVLIVYDANGYEIGRWDKEGIFTRTRELLSTDPSPYVKITNGDIESGIYRPNTGVSTKVATLQSYYENYYSYFRIQNEAPSGGRGGLYLNIETEGSGGVTSTSGMSINYQSGTGTSVWLNNVARFNLSRADLNFFTGKIRADSSYLYIGNPNQNDSMYGIRMRITGSTNGVTDIQLRTTGVYTSWTAVKSKLFKTDGYGQRAMYCYETPNPYFGDIGTGKTDETGACYVALDPVFSESVNTQNTYQVFLQKEGAGDLYIEEKAVEYFVVKGTPNLSFSWEVKAKQYLFENYRMENIEDDSELDFLNEEPDYLKESEQLFDQFINEMMEVA